MQNCSRQLAMQSCVLCWFVRCGSSNQIEKKQKKKKKTRRELKLKDGYVQIPFPEELTSGKNVNS